MRKYALLSIVLVCFALLALPAFAKHHERGDRVCVYKDSGFHGHAQCYLPGEEVADLKHADISSVRVFGNARVELFEDRDFGGRMMESSASLPDLHHIPMSSSRSWNDHVGSLRIVPTDQPYVAPVPYDEEPYSY
jgi:hypothetical protein